MQNFQDISWDLDILDVYKSYLNSLRTRTSEAYRNDFKRCARLLDRTESALIRSFMDSPQEVAEEALEAGLESDYSDGVVRRNQEALRNFGKYLAATGVLEERPYVPVPKVRQRVWMDRDEGVCLPDIEAIHRYIETLPAKRRVADTALLECLFPWGLRRNEILSILTGWVGDRSIKILEKGSRRPVEIPAPERALKALEALIEVNRSVGPVFDETPVFQTARVYNGGPRKDSLPGLKPFAFKYWIDAWGHAIGKKLTPHLFRHGAITFARDSGVPISEAAALFRHSDEYMQQLYDDKPGTRALRAIDALYVGMEGGESNV